MVEAMSQLREEKAQLQEELVALKKNHEEVGSWLLVARWGEGGIEVQG